jgi:BirA family transcriptional regulator, biotin operon repressor / biotin---[acetyl-CoA-carboxylase] ligase
MTGWDRIRDNSTRTCLSRPCIPGENGNGKLREPRHEKHIKTRSNGNLWYNFLMSLRFNIIRQLADGRFHSGEELAESCGITRAAIWKHIKKIQEILDMEIFSVRGKGYRLVQPLELLDREKILVAMYPEGQELLQMLEVHQSIESTNARLLEQVGKGPATGYACLAEQQTAGRGRRGRQWVSPYGSNIYFSLLWRFAMGPARLSGLSLAAGLSVVRSLESVGVAEIGLKWPNDVYWRDRKLAGLLLEVTGESDGPSNVVLGIGINTGMSATQGEAIDQPWVSLREITGGNNISRNRLTGLVLSNLLQTMADFELNGLQPLMQEWHRYDLHYNSPVTLHLGKKIINGIHRGIDTSGALLVEQDGEIQPFHGGEISLRPAE